MTRIWYCPNCGYEVTSRGRCHLCHDKLLASDLPQLDTGDDEDEVGYRLDRWSDRARGILIDRLNDLGLLHRFEDDELVVAAEDESTVDDLVADVAEAAVAADDGDDDTDPDLGDEPGEGLQANGLGSSNRTGDGPTVDPALMSSVQMLANAARRLRADPTDMHADADVAEASAGVFMSDGFGGADAETWAAVGRVTRRLLGVLGADEALETEISGEAAVLDQLLTPLLTGRPAAAHPLGEQDGEGEQTVYELPDWLPEQRARLGLLLDDAGIAFEWDHDDLVVPSDREEAVEEIFTEIEDGEDDEDGDGGEARYQAIAELFAASGRLAADPADEERAAAVIQWIHESAGPAPLGMDQVYWLQIVSTARSLEANLQGDEDVEQIAEQAGALQALLRTVV
jgi:hypothetical protein